MCATIPPSSTWQRGQELRLAGHAAEAARVLRQAQVAESNDARLHDELGMALSELGRHEEAIGSFLTVLTLKPDSDEACNKIGSAFAARGLFEPAIVWFQRARHMNPAGTKYLYPYGRALVLKNSIAEAAAVFNQWTKAEPNNPIARHLASAALGAGEIKKAPPEYVTALFDSCAARFDEALGKLNYRGPEIVLNSLRQFARLPANGLQIVDVGCGTGLVGPHLRPLACRLVGVDLSTGMLELAQSRGAYDELIKADISDYLRDHPSGFDVLTAADVLTYVGALEEFLQAAAAALRPGGIAVLLLEALDGEGPYRLNPSGRFSHSPKYVRDTLQNAGFYVASIREDSMRDEAGLPVATLIAVGLNVATS
jgi:predicted TPR repeat methyltransferase